MYGHHRSNSQRPVNMREEVVAAFAILIADFHPHPRAVHTQQNKVGAPGKNARSGGPHLLRRRAMNKALADQAVGDISARGGGRLPRRARAEVINEGHEFLARELAAQCTRRFNQPSRRTP